MGQNATYHQGGYIASAPAQNKAEQWDTAAGYTAWDTAGVVITQRALTSQEAAALAAQDAGAATTANGDTLRSQAAQALAANRTYVALASPTNAQVAAQVKALTRQNNGIIRLLLNQLDGTD